jgi:ribosome-associated heat shock protein Hsp15
VIAHPAAFAPQDEMSPGTDATNTVRIDRWLWAARAFRSRSLAANACDGGKVTVNGATAKPHKLIRPGDLIAITVTGGKREWRVLDVAERRGPATVARTLYDDLTPPPPVEPVAPGMPRRERGAGRPTKRERRQLDRLR